MCRFKLSDNEIVINMLKFKYIICVGSRLAPLSVASQTKKFKYIICVGSSQFVQTNLVVYSCLNTSYVSVQGRKTAIF